MSFLVSRVRGGLAVAVEVEAQAVAAEFAGAGVKEEELSRREV